MNGESENRENPLQRAFLSLLWKTKEVRRLDGILQGLHVDKSALTGQVNELTGQVNELTEQVNELTGQVNEMTGEINALVGERNRLVGQVDELQAGYGRFGRLLAETENKSVPATDKEDIVERHPSLTDAPFTIEEALTYAISVRDINRKLESGFFRDNLVVLTTLEKSGSTLIEICIREMLRTTAGVQHDVGVQRSLDHGPFTFINNLYPNALLYVGNGGPLRGVFFPRPSNLEILGFWGCKYFVLFRHPADRLVGRYCDPTPPDLDISGEGWRRDPQYLVADLFRSDMPMEEAFDEIISNGYLSDTLTWMADWLKFHDKEKSRVICYEDMRDDCTGFFSGAHEFLFGREMGPELAASIEKYYVDYRDKYQPGDKARRRYPKGYSGGIGIWKSYFSEKNTESYRRVVTDFLDTHPQGRLLLEVYPDLAL